jgi:hypothetical protein
LKQKSDERLHFALLTTAPDGDAKLLLLDVMSQAHKVTAAALRRAHRITIPKFRILDISPAVAI